MKFECLAIFLLGIIFFIFGSVVYISDLKDINNQPMKNITIPCYDKYSNLINGVNCSEEIFVNDEYNNLNGMAKGLISLMSFMIAIAGLILIVISIIGDYLQGRK